MINTKKIVYDTPLLQRVEWTRIANAADNGGRILDVQRRIARAARWYTPQYEVVVTWHVLADDTAVIEVEAHPIALVILARWT